MEASNFVGQNELLSNIQDGKPVKSYKKTILGKLLLRVWNSLTNAEAELLLSGDPKVAGEGVFDVFSQKEQVYFERMNKKHFETGMLITFVAPESQEPAERPYEQYTDEELLVIVNSKFLALTSVLNKINTVAVIARMRSLAEDAEKSSKIINAIEARLAELQLVDIPHPEETQE